MIQPMFYETHSHTTYCRHAVDEQSDYVATARRIGLDGLYFTCHNPLPDGHSAWARMYPEDFPDYVASVLATRDRFRGDIDVRLGLECDYVREFRDFLARQIDSAPFQFILGSLHPQFTEYQDAYPDRHPLDRQRTYFNLLAESAETGLFDSLSHPDLIKNETADAWAPELLMDDIRRALDRIAATGVAMEVNTSGLQKRVPEMNPFPDMLHEMAVRGIPVTLGADAHVAARVGANFLPALRMLTTAGYTSVSYFIDRQRQEASVPAFIERLRMAERAGFEPAVQLPAHSISSAAPSASSVTSP